MSDSQDVLKSNSRAAANSGAAARHVRSDADSTVQGTQMIHELIDACVNHASGPLNAVHRRGEKQAVAERATLWPRGGGTR